MVAGIAGLSAVGAASAPWLDARRLLALQRSVGNGAVAGLIVQRQGGKAERIRTAIESKDAAKVAALVPGDLGGASMDQKMSMIDILLDSGGFTQQAHVPAIWDTFGKGLRETANAHQAQWQRSFAVAAGHMRTSREVSGLQKVFFFDVEDVAKGYLDQNERYCRDEFKRLGLGENGEVLSGPPTPEQQAALAKVSDDASKLAADQEAMRDLRKIIVGYSSVSSAPGGTGEPEYVGGPAPFDPDRPPGHGPLPADKTMKTWDEVKKAYDDLDRVIRVRVGMNPTLFPLVKDAHEDTTKTKKVSTGDPAEALGTIGSGLKEVLDNIAKTRPLLHVLAPDLEPIHGQLLGGSVSPGGRNWKSDAFYGTLAKDIVEQRKPGPWWVTIGLMAAEMGAYLVAGLATGGAAFAIGMGVKGVADTALAQGRASALEAAYNTNISEESGLITKGQLDEAKASVIETAAFALIDIAGAVGEVRGVLRSVMRWEEEAAKAAKRASDAADKHMAKVESKEAAEEGRRAADDAQTAAVEARKAARSATPDEAARVEAAARKAEQNATKADGVARDMEAAVLDAAHEASGAVTHAKPREVGGHTLRFRGKWILRCSDGCAELAFSAAARVRDAIAALPTTLGSRIDELRPRLTSAGSRAWELSQQAERELSLAASAADKLAVEARILDRAALIEREIQALERQVQLESVPRGGVGKAWGDLVLSNVNDRMANVRGYLTGPVSPGVAKKITELEHEALDIASTATRLEERPRSFDKSAVLVGDDLAGRWKELDKSLEGFEREGRARSSVDELGGRSLGTTDADVGKSLGLPPGSKIPDVGTDLGGGRLLLAESKGTDIPGAFKQFETAMASPGAKTYTTIELRIYLKADVWEKLIQTGEVGGFAATQTSGSWSIPNGPGGLRVGLYPG